MRAHRDVFIEELFSQAKKDASIVLISVDMGAPALDKWRQELPDQFVAAGISEQNAVNFASGLAASGKKPYVYMMACWVARCFEQIRYSCAMPNNHITILGNGVGLGYAPAGPAHEPTEDLCYMRAIEALEIISPSSEMQVREIAKNTFTSPALRYVRLERSLAARLSTRKHFPDSSGIEVIEVLKGDGLFKISILASGYILDRAIDLAQQINQETGYSIQVIDVWKIKPLDLRVFENYIKNDSVLITIEEQARDGAFGSAILEAVSDLNLSLPTLRLSLNTAFAFENGSREELLDRYGLSISSMNDRSLEFIEKVR